MVSLPENVCASPAQARTWGSGTFKSAGTPPSCRQNSSFAHGKENGEMATLNLPHLSVSLDTSRETAGLSLHFTSVDIDQFLEINYMSYVIYL
jgi:hypothetical protein